MRHVLFLASFVLLSCSASAVAASLVINFNNQSGDTINELIATPKGATKPSVQNILPAPLSSGQAGNASLEVPEGECVFNLTFIFASGKTLERPDTDICQADGILIE